MVTTVDATAVGEEGLNFNSVMYLVVCGGDWLLWSTAVWKMDGSFPVAADPPTESWPVEDLMLRPYWGRYIKKIDYCDGVEGI